MAKLTAREVSTAKPRDKAYRLGDGGKLYLHHGLAGYVGCIGEKTV